MVDMEKVQDLGRQTEYLLFRLLMKHGFFCMRLRGSGRGYSQTIYPDLIAVRYRDGKYRVLMFEVKYRGDNRHVVIPRKKFWGYMHIKNLSGAEFYVAVLYASLREFRFLRLEDYDYEASYGYVYRYSSFVKRGLRLEDIVR